jgi:MFS family permease
MPSRAPAAAAAALAHAMITTSSLGLFPVYAVERGIPVDQIAYLLAATQFGGLVLQLPMSLSSDKIGRRTVMSVAALATLAMSCILWFAEAPKFWPLMLMAALWAGAPAALYSLGVAHANDIATDAQRVMWSGAMISLWGMGAVGGPLLAAALMDRLGAGALFAFTGVLSALLLLFLILRKLIRKRPLAPIPSSDTIGPAPGANG